MTMSLCTPHDGKLLTHQIEKWKAIMFDSVEEFKVDRARVEGESTYIPWKQATSLMLKQMTVMRKLHHG